jgi:hypothetical protein
MVIALGVATAATGLATGYLVFAYLEWERKNAPRKPSDDNDGDWDETGSLLDDFFGGDGDGGD